MNKLIKFGWAISFLLCTMSAANAEAVDKYWEELSKSYFPNSTIEETNAITIKAPSRAENGAQVPFDFSIDYPMTADKYIKSVSVIADANPVWGFQNTSLDIFNQTALQNTARITSERHSLSD